MAETRKRAHLTLPASLKRRLKITAAHEDMDMSEIVEAALRRELDALEKKRQPEAATA